MTASSPLSAEYTSRPQRSSVPARRTFSASGSPVEDERGRGDGDQDRRGDCTDPRQAASGAGRGSGGRDRDGRCGSRGRDGCDGDFGGGVPDPPDLPNERERPLAELGRRGRPDGVSDDDGGTAEPIELVRAGGTTVQVRGHRRRKRRVAGHQPVDAGRLRGRQLELLSYFVVVHSRF